MSYEYERSFYPLILIIFNFPSCQGNKMTEPLPHWTDLFGTDFQFRMPAVPQGDWGLGKVIPGIITPGITLGLGQLVDRDYEDDLDESLWQIQWDDELSRRMDEELDAYEMERIRSEVEWRREQQKADKLIRANFDAESQVEEEEKSLLSMLEER